MRLQSEYGLIVIDDESYYSFNSTDNAHSYAVEISLGNDGGSTHGITLNGNRIAVLGAGGGQTGVHEHSAVIIDDTLLIAIGNYVACLALPHPGRLLWAIEVDFATCFGLHWEASRRALISHGELAISRLAHEGELIWQASGADIFTGRFRLLPEHVEATDFNQLVYRFDYETGAIRP